MTTARLHTWIWVLIYLGIFVFALGLSVRRGDALLGGALALLGVVSFATGAVLVWVRSRMKTPADNT